MLRAQLLALCGDTPTSNGFVGKAISRHSRHSRTGCSIFRRENGDRIEAFTARHTDAQREPLVLPGEIDAEGGQVLPVGPDAEHNHDGFFYALLDKR